MKQTVSIVIPVYNEVSRLFDGIREIIQFVEKNKSYQYEILLVDDGSITPTHTLLLGSSLKKKVTTLLENKTLRLLQLPYNIGKGGAIREGVKKALGDYIVFTDIDCSVPIQHLPSLIAALDTNQVAIGSRRLPDSMIVVHQPWLREMGGRIYTALVDVLLGTQVSDATCGFKGFQRQAAKQIFAAVTVPRWSFDAEVLWLARSMGFAIQEVPVSWSNKLGSRVKLLDTVESFWDLLRIAIRRIGRKKRVLVKTELGKTKASLACDLCHSGSFEFLFSHHQQWQVQQCRNCGLTQVIPRPTRLAVAKLYQDDEAHFEPYIDQLAVHQAYFRSKLQQLQTYLSESYETISSKPLSVLDIGCLTGVLLTEAKRMGIKEQGVDISADAVKYCQSIGLAAFHGTITDYHQRFSKRRYSMITAFEIVEHDYSPRVLVESMFALVEPGGVVALSTPNHGSWWRIVMGKHWPGYTHKEHLYFFDPQSLRLLLEQVGFEVVLLKTNDARPFPLSFLFRRGADYLPVGKSIFRLIGRILKPFPINNPINPWDDLLIIGRRPL